MAANVANAIVRANFFIGLSVWCLQESGQARRRLTAVSSLVPARLQPVTRSLQPTDGIMLAADDVPESRDGAIASRSMTAEPFNSHEAIVPPACRHRMSARPSALRSPVPAMCQDVATRPSDPEPEREVPLRNHCATWPEV